MSSNPAITIVMPTFNTARFVQQAVQTVVDQSFTCWQLLVMDAGSTDGTVEIVRRFNHPNIQIICEPDEGAADAIWTGFERTHSKYFMHLCASDGYIDRDWLKICNDTMDADPEVSLVWGVPAACTEDGMIGGPHPAFSQFLKHKTIPGRLANALSWKQRLALPRIIRRRLRPRLGSGDIQKTDWLPYWLDTGLVFPDLNMCCRRTVYRVCMPPYRKGSDVLDNFYNFYMNFNQQGYLPLCIPRIANFGRTHAGQIGERRNAEIEKNFAKYRHDVWCYYQKLRKAQASHLFRDGSGTVISQWPVKSAGIPTAS